MLVKSPRRTVLGAPAFQIEGDSLSERTAGRFVVRRYPGWMFGPALAALEKLKLTDHVRLDLHLSQGTIGFFEVWIPLTEIEHAPNAI